MAMSARRPLPALAFLLALSLLTGLVWWRVFNRADDADSAGAGTTCSAQSGVALPAPNTVTLVVVNGTDRAGLAGTVSSSLAAAGFIVGAPDNDPGVVSSVAEIRFGASGMAQATLVSYYIPGSTMVKTASITDAHVQVAVGTQFPATGGVNTVDQANAAIAAAGKPTPAPPASGPAKPATTAPAC